MKNKTKIILLVLGLIAIGILFYVSDPGKLPITLNSTEYTPR